jgi:hypothetical protein
METLPCWIISCRHESADLLCAWGVGFGFLSGCLFNTAPESGSLIIDNGHDEAHTVEITIKKLGEDTTRSSASTATPGPVLWTRTDTYEVGANDRTTVPDRITEPEVFDIDARLDTGRHASTRLSLYRGGVDGTVVGGGIIAMDIYADGRVTAYTPNFD